MGAHEVKEITVFVICTKSKQIFVLKQYLVLTLHCLHAPLYSQIYTLRYTHTLIHTPTCRQTASNSLFQRILSVQSGSMRFSRCLSLPLSPSLGLSFSLLSIDCRQSTVLSVDIRCLFAAAAGHNEKHELYKQNKQSKHTFEKGYLPPSSCPYRHSLPANAFL